MAQMRHILGIIALVSCTACSPAEPEVELKGERFTVELATTPKEQTLGLMFRDSMAEDHGMLFIFPGSATRSFWMKNTRIALDIFYFDENLRLVSGAEDTPPCRVAQCPGYPSAGPAKYVLELNAGKAAELEAKPGDELRLFLD
jgi:uncharacterized membrane protein (UPF0127 family)